MSKLNRCYWLGTNVFFKSTGKKEWENWERWNFLCFCAKLRTSTPKLFVRTTHNCFHLNILILLSLIAKFSTWILDWKAHFYLLRNDRLLRVQRVHHKALTLSLKRIFLSLIGSNSFGLVDFFAQIKTKLEYSINHVFISVTI